MSAGEREGRGVVGMEERGDGVGVDMALKCLHVLY